jgi:hypothetical protein
MSMILVPVAPGSDTSIPTGPQFSAKYTLTGPDGARAVFNDQNDRDFVGMLTDITGLDSPDVRESADDLVEMDGGIHGDFFYGRRPITLTGVILNPSSADDRNRRSTKLMRASNAMRGDATLSWILSGGYEQFVKVRRQQPLRITGGWQKQFQLAVVSADPRIYGATLRQQQVSAGAVAVATGRGYDRTYDASYGGGQAAGQMIVTNSGNFESFPVLTVYGQGNNPILTNFTTGKSISLLYSLGPTDFLTLDTLNRTVTLNNTTSRYSAVDFINTDWWGVVPGDNDIRLAFNGAFQNSASLSVSWRDAWL